MPKIHVDVRRVKNVDVFDVYRRVEHPADIGLARDVVTAMLSRQLPGYLRSRGDAVTNYMVRGVKALPEQRLQPVIDHGFDRHNKDFQSPYEPFEPRQFDTVKTAWAYPINGDPFYPIGSSIGHALQERSNDPSLSRSRYPIVMLLLHKAGAVEIRPNFYAFSEPSKALRAITMIHFF